MISIDKKILQDIYINADKELRDAYIHNKKEAVYGWRNGLKKGLETSPGATATALILNYFIDRGDSWIDREIPLILEYLLKIQLRDNEGKRTGWEVMSLKPISGKSIPSVDVTAIVISTLYKHTYWLSNKEEDNLQKDMEEAISEGSQWLLKQGNQGGAWGIHSNDMNRIFVTCNVLNALIPLMGHEIFAKSLRFLKNAQYKDGSWGETQGNNDTGDIYHTAKVLNLLTEYFASDAKDSIQEGIHYLKRIIKNELPNISYVEEKIPDCNGNAKSYYHDGYSELLLLMQKTSEQWTQGEYFKVIEKFLASKINCNEERKFYETITDQKTKKQIWLLIPAASQSFNIANRLFPDSSEVVCLSDDEKLLGFDLNDLDKKKLMGDRKRDILKYLTSGILVIVLMVMIAMQIYLVGFEDTASSMLGNCIWALLGVIATIFITQISNRISTARKGN